LPTAYDRRWNPLCGQPRDDVISLFDPEAGKPSSMLKPEREAWRQLEDVMQKPAGPKKQKCKNCEGKGTLKKGNKVVRCQRCDGTGIKR
jgi:hypothetical protein